MNRNCAGEYIVSSISRESKGLTYDNIHTVKPPAGKTIAGMLGP